MNKTTTGGSGAVPGPGTAGQLRRWLREGVLSGEPRGILRGLTDILFFPAFAFCFTWEFFNTTMFKNDLSDALRLQMDSTYHRVVILLLVCGVIAVLLQDSIRQAVFEAALLAAGFLHWKAGAGKYEYFVLCVLIVGMTGRSFKVLLSLAFTIGCAVMAAAFIASQAGIIEDLVYVGGRHSFGIIYCTDCAAHILFLMLMYVMLRMEKLTFVEFAALLPVCAIMIMTKAQSDIGCGFLLLGLLLIARLGGRWKKRLRASRLFRGLGAAAGFSFLFCSLAAFAVTLGFDRNNKALRKKLQYSLIRRLEMNQEALRDHPFSLFGTKIEEHGFGGRTKNLPGWDKYFFIDCSYIRLFVIGGILLFVLILVLMTYTQLRCFAGRRYGLVFVLAVVAVACLMEHHLMEYYYNIFPLMAFSGSRFFRDDPAGESAG